MKKFLILLFFLAIFSCKQTTEKNESQVDSKSNVAEESKSTNENFNKSFIGKLGRNIEVVFNISNGNGKIEGNYFYQKKGLNIRLIGTLKNDVLTMFELDDNGNKTATIHGKIIGNQINGTWKNIKTGKILDLELTQTTKIIPEIPKNIEGTYRNSEETACNFRLTISKKGNEYFYNIKTDQRKLNGKITFYRSLDEQLVYITFEGIQWAEDNGQLDENGESKYGNTSLPIGIEGLLNSDGISIQNYGNAMNNYTKFSDCGDKYIILKK